MTHLFLPVLQFLDQIDRPWAEIIEEPRKQLQYPSLLIAAQTTLLRAQWALTSFFPETTCIINQLMSSSVISQSSCSALLLTIVDGLQMGMNLLGFGEPQQDTSPYIFVDPFSDCLKFFHHIGIKFRGLLPGKLLYLFPSCFDFSGECLCIMVQRYTSLAIQLPIWLHWKYDFTWRYWRNMVRVGLGNNKLNLLSIFSLFVEFVYYLSCVSRRFAKVSILLDLCGTGHNPGEMFEWIRHSLRVLGASRGGCHPWLEPLLSLFSTL